MSGRLCKALWERGSFPPPASTYSWLAGPLFFFSLSPAAVHDGIVDSAVVRWPQSMLGNKGRGRFSAWLGLAGGGGGHA